MHSLSPAHSPLHFPIMEFIGNNNLTTFLRQCNPLEVPEAGHPDIHDYYLVTADHVLNRFVADFTYIHVCNYRRGSDWFGYSTFLVRAPGQQYLLHVRKEDLPLEWSTGVPTVRNAGDILHFQQ